MARLAERLERRLYNGAGAIVTVTEPFRRDIAQRTRDPRKITVVTNGTTQTWLDAGGIDADRARLALPSDRFIWAYAGNLGLAQGLEAALDAAGLLGDGYQLLLLGDGPLRDALKRRARALPPGRSPSTAWSSLRSPRAT
jgi:glycosyltransferase involved in cell wall biosynthesis